MQVGSIHTQGIPDAIKVVASDELVSLPSTGRLSMALVLRTCRGYLRPALRFRIRISKTDLSEGACDINGVPAMETKEHVIDADEVNFQQAVLEESQSRPVLVDLWATWCEPCKTLGPALESVASDYAGAILLAKVDVDRSPRLAQAFGAQSIPLVVALFEGRPIDSFTGALSAQEVKNFVNNVLTRCGLPVPGRDLRPAGEDVQQLEGYWRERLAEDEKDGEALLELGRLFLRTDRAEEAGEYLEKVRAKMPQYDDAQAALKLRELMGEIRAAGGEESITARLDANPEDPEAQYLASCAEGIRGAFVTSLQVQVGLIRTGPPDVRKKAKNAASVIFRAAGRDDDRVEELRRELARLLF